MSPEQAKRWGLGAAAVLATVPLFNGYQQRAFDSWVHMFFADHYRRGWFTLWEPRWYGGFEVTSYPPLAHQLLALLSWPLGLEVAYLLMTFVAMLSMGALVRRAVTPFLPTLEAELGFVLLLVPLWPTAHRFAYVYGQLPMLVATPLALAAMGALYSFLRQGGLLRLGMFAALAGATAGTHHVTMVFLVLGSVGVTLRCALHPRPVVLALAVRRALVAAAAAGVALTVVVGPFLAVASNEPQVEIPHVSRDPIHLRPIDGPWVEHLLQLVLALALAVIAAATRRGPLLLMAAGCVLLTVLALGTTTPLPRWLFGSQWRWLTYDKFHFWAALLLPAAFTAVLPRDERRRGWVVAALAVILMPATAIEIGHKRSDALQPKYIEDISGMLAVLQQPEAERYRHLTLGFGDQFCRLSIYGRSPNLDGDYHTARRDGRLRQSGLATVDAAKYYPQGPDILRYMLSRPDETSLRWVFVNDEWYYPYLFEAGFELKDVWPNGVTLFERANTPPLRPSKPPARPVVALLWGTTPLACLLIAAALAAVSWRRRRSASEGWAQSPSATHAA